MNKKYKLFFIAFSLGFGFVQAQVLEPPYLNSKLPVEKRVDDLMGRMTLREKIGQMAQYTGDPEHGKMISSDLDDLSVTLTNAADKEYAMGIKGKAALVQKGEIGSFLKVPGTEAANYLQRVAEQSRLKIPLLIATDAIHGHGKYTKPVTVFPTELTLASSFTPKLAETMGRITALEMRATGYQWTFSPNVEILRDQRWGRSGETFGEDTYLVTQMGRAMVKGYQMDELGDKSVLACAKHLAAGGESFNGINGAEADVSERTLLGVYLPPFKAAIDEGVFTVMAAHNAIGGIPCHANKQLLTDILRKQLGFDGFVVSDWNDVRLMYSKMKVAKDFKEACRMAVDAGIDCHMHGGDWVDNVEELVNEGTLEEWQIDRGVRAILEAKFRLGLFENRYVDPVVAEKVLLAEDHKKAALEMCRKSLVLLKNDDHLLPIKSNVKSILVTGPQVNSDAQIGDWINQQPNENIITILEGIRDVAPESVQINFEDCGRDFDISEEQIRLATEAAKKSQIAIVGVGESAVRYRDDKTAGENMDYTTLDLPGNQLELIQSIEKTGTPVVVVLINTRALSINWCAEHVPAILEAWEPGMMGGYAVAEALFGKVNPSGKLPVSFPRSSGHLQCYYNHTPLRLDHYGNSPATPLFPFGHGLSYTTFRYSNLKCPKIVKIGRPLEIRCDLTNTGLVDGDEIVLLYLNDVFSSVTTPVQELKFFQRVSLKAGQTKTVTLTLLPEALSLINADLKRVVEPGKFEVMVGELKTEFEAIKE